MSIFSKLFGSKSSPENKDIAAIPQPESQRPVDEVPVMPNNHGVTVPSTLPEALRYIVQTKGQDYLLGKGFIYMLNDYNVLKDLPAAKRVLSSMLSEGYIRKMVEEKPWSVISLSICTEYIRQFGTQQTLVAYIVNSLGYGLGKHDSIPEYCETTEQTVDEATERLRQKSNQRGQTAPPTSSQRPKLPINPHEPFLNYRYPSIDLLKEAPVSTEADLDYLRNQNQRIVELLHNYKVQVQEITATSSDLVDFYECTLVPGSRLSHLKKEEDNLALTLCPRGVRMQIPIPGTEKIGIEMPSPNPRSVALRDVFDRKEFDETTFELPCFIGKNLSNKAFAFDLATLPHLLISGASGQGKSICIHDIMMSLLYKKHPNEVKFVLFDYKRIELGAYLCIKDHFAACIPFEEDNPIVSNDEQALSTIKNLKEVFDSRFEMLAKVGARNIKDYNNKYCNGLLNLADGNDYLPYIIVVIDEYSHIQQDYRKDLEPTLLELAQKGRTVGIHLIIGLNRPTLDVISSALKNELKARIAFRVSNASESRIILNANGAEKLYGPGDALFMDDNTGIQRIQCAEVLYDEIDRVCKHVEQQPGPVEPYELSVVRESSSISNQPFASGPLDPLFEDAARAIVMTQMGSTAMIQRRFSIGYNRAGRLMDQLQDAGIVGEAFGSKPRDVLITDENSLSDLFCRLRNL